MIYVQIGIAEIPETIAECIAAIHAIEAEIKELRGTNYLTAHIGLLNTQHAFMCLHTERLARKHYNTTGETEFDGVVVQLEPWVEIAHGDSSSDHERLQFAIEHAPRSVDVDWNQVSQAIVKMERHAWPWWATPADPSIHVKLPVNRYLSRL